MSKFPGPFWHEKSTVICLLICIIIISCSSIKKVPQGGHEGTVYIKMLVDTTGDVLQVVIDKSSGFVELDSAAAQQARTWKFKPQDYKVWLGAPVKFEFKKDNDVQR